MRAGGALPLAAVEPVQVHHLGPGGDEVLNELRLGIGGGVDLGHGPQLRVGTEDQVDARARPFQLAARIDCQSMDETPFWLR